VTAPADAGGLSGAPAAAAAPPTAGRPLEMREAPGHRRRAIVLLACVLALQSADTAAVGAVGSRIERALGVGDAQLGLLVAVASLVGALATLPAGALVDRWPRVRALALAILLWSLAMAAGALADTYGELLASRVALGGVTALGGPAVASLSGDLFRPDERARMYGVILAGELAGAGVGFLVAGNLAGAVGWRGAFWALAAPALALAVALWRLLPEPARRGGGRQETMTFAGAVRHVLRVRTNVYLIAASALGYFFLSGLQTFAVEFLRGRFGLGQAAATTLVVAVGAGALVGVVAGGRAADALLQGGRASARPEVAAAALAAAAAVFAPGFIAPSLGLAVPLLAVAVMAVAASNPPLDAARLDIIPPALWGRAEGVRTALRSLLVAAGPLAFGLVSERLGGRAGGFVGGGPHAAAPAGAHGLALTFLAMTGTLVLSAVILVGARGRYVADVAAARGRDAGAATANTNGNQNHLV
jgi:predicted MFS family arabinose efflux permease